MIYAVYILAAAAVGLMMGFVTLSVVLLQKTVSDNIRSKTISLISVYDRLLEEKSIELAKLSPGCRAENAGTNEEAKLCKGQEGKEKKDKDAAGIAAMNSGEMLSAAERAGAAAYRDGSIGETYRKIRENFSFSLGEILPKLQEMGKSEDAKAEELLRAMDYDTIYRLSTLPSQQQIEVLRESFSESESQLLDAYLAKCKKFSVLEFYHDLKRTAEQESKRTRLRVPKSIAAEWTTRDGVQIIPDEGICEGLQIEEGNLLYDYCIKTRELN